jgi:hypothetical protein
MILLPIILTPIGITILLFVMSWSERALDRERRPERTQLIHSLPTAPVAALAPASEFAGLIERVTAQ